MTNSTQHKFIRINSFVDEAFDTIRTRDFKLVLQVSTDGVLVTVNEKAHNKYIAFERFSFQHVYRFEDVCVLLEDLIKQSAVLKYPYYTVDCLLVNNLSTLVPSAVYEEERKKTYLKFNTFLEGDELILTDHLKTLDAKNIFALPFCVKSKLDFAFSNIKYHHFSSVLIEALLAKYKNQAGQKIIVHIQPTHFQVVVMDGKQLLFYNMFNHHSTEDFIYYLLFVCEQLHLNPEKVDLRLLGEIEKNSAIHLITQKYIRNILFEERTDQADYSYQLQALPKHSYFTLFNFSLL
ncbi:MAG TPA: DUF3822 family protein [Bacteroidia bacterium]|jgi:hypothetical protein|nr:DUF3822 family protein [Bacteroidia bacterium]